MWTSTDPAGQFWNAYSYSPNPINSVDPDGREVYPDDFIGPLNVGDVRASEIGLPANTWWTGFQIYTNENLGIHFPTEGDAGTFAGYLAEYVNYQNEVASFIVNRQDVYQLTPFVFSNERDVVSPGLVPVLATGVFHTHVNDQLRLSFGDERYARNQRLNIYMRNTKHNVSDFKPWYQCETGFDALQITP